MIGISFEALVAENIKKLLAEQINVLQENLCAQMTPIHVQVTERILGKIDGLKWVLSEIDTVYEQMVRK